MEKTTVFCKGGGCTAKLGAGVLEHVLSKLPPGNRDDRLLAGFAGKEDAAVYRLNDNEALVQTLDFFPPMIEDPYTFGQIAAANALSDIYAMGGDVRLALNIVCFPEKMDLNILGEILKGGAKKVEEAGGVLAGGHSIADDSVKYGLSVTGIVHPEKFYRNNTGMPGDALILAKKLGVGIICTAARVGEASDLALSKAVESMTMLNKQASQICRKYPVHACTDVTGFSFLGHLHEMMGGRLSCIIDVPRVPFIEEAASYADEFLLTAAAQRNRNFLEKAVVFQNVPFAMEEILFDPQTSGGLFIAVEKKQAAPLTEELCTAGYPAEIVGEILPKTGTEILCKM